MSVTMGLPVISSPSAKASLEGCLRKASLSSTVRRYTDLVSLFGTSMPTAALPGIGASIRMPLAARFRAMSSARLTILLTLTP